MIGGLSYAIQDTFSLFGTKNPTTLARTPVTLESTYQTESSIVATKTIRTGGYSKISIDGFYTMGATESSNSIEVRLEASTDGTNWARLVNESASGGTSTITAREFTFVGTNAALATFNITLEIGYKFMRIAAKETGVATNKGTIYADVTLSGG